MLKFVSIALILVPLATPNMAQADHARRFTCPELHHLHKGSLAYRDTLDACKWDFSHPDPHAIVR